jgi:hypothetical protein
LASSMGGGLTQDYLLYTFLNCSKIPDTECRYTQRHAAQETREKVFLKLKNPVAGVLGKPYTVVS